MSFIKYWGLLFILFSFSVKSQQISGVVWIPSENGPATYATVVLKSLPDSTLISGGITMSDGNYSFDNNAPGEYYLGVTYMGYSPAGTSIILNEGSGDLMIDTLFLKVATTEMEAAVIKGDRLSGKELVDRTVYTIPAEIAGISNNGYDLLKRIPQIQVDFQNNVTMNGSSNFIVEVDGKQRDKEFLARLVPSDIETIEIITNPSGKYEGNIDGVINIILKKEARYGVSGSAGAYVKPLNKPTAITNASIDYGMGNLTFYITAFALTQQLNSRNSNFSKFNFNDSITDLTGDGGFGVTVGSVNAGFDYYITDKKSLSLNINTRPISQSTNSDNTNNLFNSNSLIQFIESSSDTKMKSNEVSGSVYYKQTYKKPVKEFSVEATWYKFRSVNDNLFDNQRFNYSDNSTVETVVMDETSVNNRSYYSAKLNYIQPIGFKTKMEMGYQFYNQIIAYDFSSSLYINNNIFDYSEIRNSAYAGITFNLDKLGFQSNLRVEHSKNTIDGVADSGYYCILPSANVQYKFSASQNLKFTYNRRISRPGVYDLNPFEKVSQNYTLSKGNPLLEPEIRDRLQLTYTLNFKKNYAAPYIYYQYVKNKQAVLSSLVSSDKVNNATTILTKPYNVLTGGEKGAGINALLWYVNLNAFVYKGKFNEYAEGINRIPAKEYFSYNINSSAFYKFEKIKLTTFVFLSYKGVSIEAQSKSYSLPLYGIGSQKEAGNHTMGFFWLLPGSNYITFMRTITETAYLNTESNVTFDASWYIQIMYTYKFNKGKNVKKVNAKLNIESDSKSGGLGQ